MSNELFYEDIAKQFAGPSPVGAAAAGADVTAGHSAAMQGQGNWQRAKSYGESMLDSYPDGTKRHVLNSIIKSYLLYKSKLGTGDVSGLLNTSISPRFTFIRKTETIGLNIVESIPGPMLVVNDWTRRIVDRHIGTVRAGKINPEAVPLNPALLQTVRSQKLNTLAFYGDAVAASFVAQSMVGQQQPGTNLLQEETDAEMQRMRNALNYDIWNSIEQSNFTPPNVTEFGGLISRIVTNTDDLGGADIDADDLEEMSNTIEGVVSGAKKLVVSNRRQVGNVRTIEVARYGGQTPLSYIAWADRLRTEFLVPVDKMFEPSTGPAIGCVHDDDIGNNVLMMSIEPEHAPRLAYFLIDGQPGPHLFVKPPLSTSYELRESALVLMGVTLDDPAEDTKFLKVNSL